MRINQEVRKAIMAFLKANPKASTAQILTSVNLEPRNGAKLLKGMADRGLLTREEATITSTDSRGNASTNQGFVYSVCEPQQGHAEIAEIPTGIQQRPGYYSQSGGGWQANEKASGGGQASGRSRVYVCASAGML
jgi:hypothetical protein